MFPWKQVDACHTNQLRSELFEEARIDKPYLILIVTSCAIATFGLLSNSAAVIIGAMVIAPLMLPIRAVAFAALEGNPLLFRLGFLSVTVGTLMAVLLSCALGWLSGITNYGSEILARTQPTLLDLGIAITAGAIGGYGKINAKVSSSLAGTAISVALMPPICVIGLALSQGNWELSKGASLLYLTNLLGIALACMIVFVLAGYTPLQQAQRALVGAVSLTSLLLFPLGLSFIELVSNARLQTNVKRALLNRTITFQRMELVDLKINWLQQPAEVRLTVYAKEPVTSRQVELLEVFLKDQIGKPFHLIFIVSYVEEVKSEPSLVSIPLEENK